MQGAFARSCVCAKNPADRRGFAYFPRGGLGRQRDLREDDGEEHQRAAEVFARGHVLV